MRHAAVPIGVAEDARGIRVSLPRQFWLVVGLKRVFPRIQAAEEPWTYRIPPTRGAARRVEAWIAEVELQVRAEARRRAWTAADADWLGTREPQAPVPVATEPALVTLPRKRTARAVLALLAALGAGAVMVAVVGRDGARGYRLAPTGRRIPTAVAERAIGLRLIAPGNDGLFGPDWSQTWRAPTTEETAAAEARARAARPKRRRTREAGQP